jgi:hypothetical protein
MKMKKRKRNKSKKHNRLKGTWLDFSKELQVLKLHYNIKRSKP